MKLYKVVFLSLIVTLISGTNWAKTGSLRSQITRADSVDEVKALIEKIDGPLKYLTRLSKKAHDKLEQLSKGENKCDALIAAAITKRNEVCKKEVKRLQCIRNPECSKEKGYDDDDYADYEAEILVYGCVSENKIDKDLAKNRCFWNETDV